MRCQYVRRVRVHALPSARLQARSSARPAAAGSIRPGCRALSAEAAAAPALEPELLVANAPGLRIVDLNRPRVLNSLSGSMVRTLLPLVQDWQQPGGDVHIVVLRGSEPRAFCAGGDIRFLLDCASVGEGPPLAAAHAFFFDEYTLNHALGTSRVPIVSLLEGIVMGGGVGLSIHGHVRVATESTLFAMPETGIGFFPDVGATHALPRLRSPALGSYLGLTGARLSGRDVVTAGALPIFCACLYPESWLCSLSDVRGHENLTHACMSGIATHFVTHSRLPMVEGVLCQFGENAISTGNGLNENALHNAIRSVAGLDDALAGGSGDSAQEPPSFLEVHAGEIDHCFSQPDVPSIVAAVEQLASSVRGSAPSREAAGSHWAVRAARALALASPTSLAVTLEALRRGETMQSLGQCLAMEYRVAQRFLKHPDFVAGVGAVLSGGAEERRPQWAASPTADEVTAFFEPVEGGELQLE